MKQHFWHSGKFWLKFSVSTMAACMVLTAVISITLYVLFSPDRIRQYADQAVAETGRTIRYDADISRSWFPRPTITLHHVAISKPHNDAAVIYVDEMRIGVAWKSLLGATEIEKWVWIHPEITLIQQSAAKWNLQDLLDTNTSGSVNRFIIENGKIAIDTDLQHYDLTDINLTIRGLSSDTPQFSGNGKLPHAPLPNLNWQINGALQQQGKNWQLTNLSFNGTASWQQEPVTFQGATNGIWLSETHQLQLQNLKLKADTQWHQTHLNLALPSLTFGHLAITAPQADAVLTAQYRNRQWDAAIHAGSFKAYPNNISLEKIGIDGNWQGANEQGSFNLDTDIDWQTGRGLSLMPFTLNTRVDSLKGEPRPRFVGDWNGQFKWQPTGSWQMQIDGTFDRQPANIELFYAPAAKPTPAQLTAAIRLEKLSLIPYWNHFQTATATFPYPKWLQQPDAPQIKAELSINSLQMPDLVLDNVHTHISADRKRIIFPDFRAALYGGQTEGEIGIANTRPTSYHVQQYAQNVQVRPLMQDLLNYNNISGRGDVLFNLAATGNNRKEWLSGLNGTLSLTLRNGAWEGIDLNNLLKNQTAVSGSTPSTPFNRFTVNSTIEKGISHHKNAELLSDTLTVSASGSTNFNTQTMDENLLVRANGMKDKPIPFKIRGPIANPSVTVDYPKLTKGLNTPEEKQKALTNALKEQWQWLNRSDKR